MGVKIARYSAKLTRAIGASDTLLYVSSVNRFPQLTSEDHVNLSLEDVTGNIEVVRVNSVNGTVFTVVRGIDNTTARPFPISSLVEIRNNPLTLRELIAELMMESQTDMPMTSYLTQQQIIALINSMIESWAYISNSDKLPENKINYNNFVRLLQFYDLSESVFELLFEIESRPTQTFTATANQKVTLTGSDTFTAREFGLLKINGYDDLLIDYRDIVSLNAIPPLTNLDITNTKQYRMSVNGIVADRTVRVGRSATNVPLVSFSISGTYNAVIVGADRKVSSGAEIKEKLETLSGTNRLAASAIKDLPSSSGGLSSVTSDTTLSGSGTTSSPLAVAKPFTDADETKLDGIETGATADQTAQEIRDKIQGLSGNDKLDATTLKNLPQVNGKYALQLAYAKLRDLVLPRLFTETVVAVYESVAVDDPTDRTSLTTSLTAGASGKLYVRTSAGVDFDPVIVIYDTILALPNYDDVDSVASLEGNAITLPLYRDGVATSTVVHLWNGTGSPNNFLAVGFSAGNYTCKLQSLVPRTTNTGLTQTQVDLRITTLRPNAFTDADETKLDAIPSQIVGNASKLIGFNPSGNYTTVNDNFLRQVQTGNTITGDGTSSGALDVVNPFTDNDETKLDAIPDQGATNSNKLLGFNGSGNYEARDERFTSTDETKLDAIPDQNRNNADKFLGFNPSGNYAVLDAPSGGGGASGDITSVTARDGLDGGGASGAVSLGITEVNREKLSAFTSIGWMNVGTVGSYSSTKYTNITAIIDVYQDVVRRVSPRQENVWVTIRISTEEKARLDEGGKFQLAINETSGVFASYDSADWEHIVDASGNSYYQVLVSDIPVASGYSVREFDDLELNTINIDVDQWKRILSGRPVAITRLPVPLVPTHRYILSAPDTIDQSVKITALQEQTTLRGIEFPTHAVVNGIRAFIPTYSGNNAAALRGKVFLSLHSVPPSAVSKIHLGTALGSQSEYTVAAASVPGETRLYEISGLSYNDIIVGTGYWVNVEFADGSFVYAPTAVAAGDWTARTAQSVVHSPGSAAVWAENGNADPFPVNKLPYQTEIWARVGNDDPLPIAKVPAPALQTVYDRDAGPGLIINGSNADARSGIVAPTPPFDMDATGRGSGVLEVEVEFSLTNRLSNTIAFQQVANRDEADDALTARVSNFTSISSLLALQAYTPSTVHAVEIGQVTVYKGSTELGDVIVYVSRDANNQIALWMLYNGQAGSENFTLSTTVTAYFQHHDAGPDAGQRYSQSTVNPSLATTAIATDTTIAVNLAAGTLADGITVASDRIVFRDAGLYYIAMSLNLETTTDPAVSGGGARCYIDHMCYRQRGSNKTSLLVSKNTDYIRSTSNATGTAVGPANENFVTDFSFMAQAGDELGIELTGKYIQPSDASIIVNGSDSIIEITSS